VGNSLESRQPAGGRSGLNERQGLAAILFLSPGLEPLPDPVGYFRLRKASQFQAGSLFEGRDGQVDRVLPLKSLNAVHLLPFLGDGP
jgi:hypothetical protein